MNQCAECGRYYSEDELIETGFDDDGGEIFPLFICQTCAADSNDPHDEEH